MAYKKKTKTKKVRITDPVTGCAKRNHNGTACKSCGFVNEAGITVCDRCDLPVTTNTNSPKNNL